MKENKEIESTVPKSIGIIMDGNRRWARARELPSFEGHRRGYEKLREVLIWCKDVGINNLTVYAFSTENWNRTKEEVGYLMNLFREMIANMTKDALANDIRIIFIGERRRFDPDIILAINNAEFETVHCQSLTFCIALSYGGRVEIIDAIHRISKEKLSSISEEEFSQLLWTKDIPDPDLIIRTSGEERLSNFLPWQSVYSELFFTKTFWPDFSQEEFSAILANFAERERRRGK